MNHRDRFFAACFVPGLLLLCGCTTSNAVAEKESSAAPVTKVATVRVERKTLRRTTAQPGEIAAFDAAPLFAKVNGYVERVHVDIGDAVKEKDLLVTLSIPETEQELKGKQAQVAVAEAEEQQAQAATKVAEAAIEAAAARLDLAKAGVQRTDADYERWKSEFTRISELVEKGAVTAKLQDETRNQLRSAEAAKKESSAQVAAAESGLAEARAKLDSAKADALAAEARVRLAKAEQQRVAELVAYHEIRAPFDGAVAERHVNTGHYVQAAAGAGHKPLVTLVSSGRVRVFCDVPETDAGFAGQADPAVVRVQSLGNRTFQGAVTRTAAALDETARTLRTEIDLPNDGGELKPGMYAHVMITVAERPDVLVVPATAVFTDSGNTWCAVVSAGKVERKRVESGLHAGGEVEVVSGLALGDEVIPKGAAGFQDGQSVEVVPPAAK